MMRSAPMDFIRRAQAGAWLGKTGRLAKAGAAALAFTIASVPLAAHADIASVAPRVKPPAPGPVYISKTDKDRLLAVSAALKARQFSTAKSLIPFVSDPIAQALGQWMYFMAEDPLVDINEADAFLDSNPDWPLANRIHAFVEKRIPANAPADQVLSFFDTRSPATGDGKVKLARALFSVGDKEGGERLLRDAWIHDTFTVAEEQRVLSAYGGKLEKEDHAARVDMLLWDRQVTNARRVFPHLDSRERRKAEARAALLLSASSAAGLYDKLPEEDRLDSGVLQAAVRYYRRRGDEQYAIALAGMAPDDPEKLRNGAQWWIERSILMRWALKNGRFTDAYALAAGHGTESGADFADAEFYAGWIALRFLNAPERAETHFLALASEVGSPISVSRAYYWLGRAAAAKGDDAAKNAYFTKAAEHYYSYYGQMAAEETGEPYVGAKFAGPAEATPADRALFASRPTVAALRMLSDLDLDYEFMVFAYHVDDQLERPGEYLELARLTEGEGAPHLTVRAGKVAIQRGAFAPEVAYPLIFVPEEAARFVSPEIILGLSRQESEFNPRAYSRAGARGVMQLIPTTAQITARKEGLAYSRTALLDDPIYNMTIGSAHLSHLLDRFDGSLVMTLAAYNAGAARVDQWVGDYGDPRSDAVDPLDWVELIPFSETRNYVQRVLENVQVYRGRLNDRPIPGRLYSDIERGGARDRIAALKPPSIVLANAAAPFDALALPPAPERTVERARRFAMTNPAVAAPADAASQGDPAAGAEPIAFTPEDAQKPAPRKKPAAKRKTRAPAPAPAATASTEADATADAALPETPALLMRAEIASPEPQIPAPEAETQKIMPVAGAAEEADPGAPDDAAAILARMTPVMNEEAADEIDDVSAAGDGMDACLTYRDFLARNAEDEAEAADLNAGMLAELVGGGGSC